MDVDFENQSTTSPWASRRKTIILIVAVLMLSAISFAIFWKYWYHAPTCFDKLQNGDETGIDCGGSCALVCKGDAIKPIVKWDPRLFEVLPGLWSALVYVENPNTDADAVYVPYSFTFYDENNKVLNKREGVTILPKNKTVGIFEGSIIIENRAKPKRAVFELSNDIVWEKNKNQNENIKITHSSILKLDSAPRVEAVIENNETEEIRNIELVIAIFDGADNTIAASRTFVESIPKDESAEVFFTWPRPFELGLKACERPSNIILLLDRSGSMASLSIDPPEPLSQAKDAAISFVKKLRSIDKVGVISFASETSEPIDLTLTPDLNSAEQIIGQINIEPDSTQYTNIFEALHSAWQELVSSRGQDESSKIVVLLTDGVATYPKNPLGNTEEDDIKYAENLAIKEASNAKKDSLTIYTIGLGDEINESFLKTVASGEGNYFFAPSVQDLESIYKNISFDICKEVPARVEITYKIFGSSI